MIRPRGSGEGGGAERIAPFRGHSRSAPPPRPRMDPEEWSRRALAWSQAHAIPVSLWLGPNLDPLPEPHASAAPADCATAAADWPATHTDQQKDHR